MTALCLQEDKLPDDNISIPDQDYLATEIVTLLTARNSPDKIDLAGKISTKSEAPADPFLDQLSTDLAEDEKKRPSISLHLAVIVNNFWQQNMSWDKFKDRLSKYPTPENLFEHAMKRSGMVREYSILT